MWKRRSNRTAGSWSWATGTTAGTTTSSCSALQRPDGSPDTSFGSAGTAVFDVPGSEDEKGLGLALQADGKIVVAGYVRFAGKRDVLVARFTAAALSTDRSEQAVT